MCDDCFVMLDQGVYFIQCVFLVGFGEVIGKCVGDYLMDVLVGFVVKIGGVDQVGCVYLGVYSFCLLGLCYILVR